MDSKRRSIRAWGQAYREALEKQDWMLAARVCEDRLREGPSAAEQVWLFVNLARTCRHMWETAAETQALRAAAGAVADVSTVLSWPHLLDFATCLERAGEIELARRTLETNREKADEATRTIILERLRDALEHKDRFSSCPSKIIALGQTCMAQDVAIRWGLGSLVVDGPFVAGVFFQNAPSIAVEDGLVGFTDSSYHKLTLTPSGYDAVTIPRYHTFLNHETGPYWINGSTEKIISLYTGRVAKFRAALARSPVLFVFTQNAQADVDRLAKAVDRFSPGAEFRILVVDWSEDSTFADTYKDKRIVCVAVPKPRQDYTWHLSSSFNTAEGLAFERSIAMSIAATLERLSTSRVRSRAAARKAKFATRNSRSAGIKPKPARGKKAAKTGSSQEKND